MKEASHKRQYIVWVHRYERSGIDKSINTESDVSRGRKWGMTANRAGSLLGLAKMVIVVQLWI
jgi:hypothetical protein